MITNYRINIKSDTDTLSLSPYSVCRVLAGGLAGFDFPEIEVKFTERAFGDGGKVSSERICPRVMSVYFEVTDRKKFTEIHDSVMRIMNPHGDVTISTYMFGRHRFVDVKPYKTPEFILENAHRIPRIKLTFAAGEPYFTDGKKYRAEFPVRTPILSFPLNMMKNAGTVCSFATSRQVGNIHNPGDAECGFVAYLCAAYGAVSEPSVSLGTHYVKLMEELSEGDTVKIDTRQGLKCVVHNGARKYTFSRDSNFFALQPGDNKIFVSATSGGENLVSEFEFSPRYLGA